MPKKISATGCFKYVYFVFVAEGCLALYWFIVLTYVSVKHYEKLLAGIAFGLHYAGLIALSGFFDELNEKKKSISELAHHNAAKMFNKTTKSFSSKTIIRSKGGSNSRGSNVIRTSSVNDDGNNNIEKEKEEEDDMMMDTNNINDSEREFSRKLDKYPFEYGVALFVAMISDLFSLVDVILHHNNHDDEGGEHDSSAEVVFYLYAVLFGSGLYLTVSSIIWSFVFYSRAKSIANATFTRV